LVRVRQSLTSEERGRSPINFHADVTHPLEVAVVKHDCGPIACQPNIAFDSGTEFDRGLESRKAVFRNSGTMESAVGKPEGSGVERISL
jgi:hypothetical protein